MGARNRFPGQLPEPNTRYVSPGDDLQAAIDAAAADYLTTGVVQKVEFDESTVLIRSDVIGERTGCTFDTATNFITAIGHGLIDGDRIRFDDVAGTTAAAYAGWNSVAQLTTRIQYFVRDKTADTFKIAHLYDGTAIDLTGTPTGAGHFHKLTEFVLPAGVELVAKNPGRWSLKPRSPKRHKISMTRKPIITFTFDDFKSGTPDGEVSQMTALGFSVGWQYLRYLGVGPTFAMNCDDVSRAAAGDRETLQRAARIMWALGGDISSHGWHSHAVENDPYIVTNDTDENVLSALELELRQSKRDLEAWKELTVAGSMQTVVGDVPSFVQPGGNTWNWDAALYDNRPNLIGKLQASYAKIIQNTYEFFRTYGYITGSKRFVNTYDEYWQGYMEIVDVTTTPTATIELMVDKAIAENACLDLMTHKMSQQVADILDYVVAKRDAGTCLVMSFNKARYVEFTGSTANAYIYGGNFEKFTDDQALTAATWYSFETGAAAGVTGDKCGALVSVRAGAITGIPTTIVIDVAGTHYLEIAGAADATAYIQISSNDIATGQNTIQFEVIVPTGKVGKFRLTHNQYGFDPITQGVNGWPLADRIETLPYDTSQYAYDDVTLAEGTHVITRSMIVRPSDMNITFKIAQIAIADNTIQIGKIGWF